MKIVAIDPGTNESAFLIYQDGTIERHGMIPNYSAPMYIADICYGCDLMAIEMIASYGMPCGFEIFETCIWIGRIIERCPIEHILIFRKDIKLHICGTARAKDANIRQALIDRIGPAGTKSNPGPTYGITKHAWAALAVAVYAADTEAGK